MYSIYSLSFDISTLNNDTLFDSPVFSSFFKKFKNRPVSTNRSGPTNFEIDTFLEAFKGIRKKRAKIED
jgi:hypothetical protein